jgi:hypothetical protein
LIRLEAPIDLLKLQTGASIEGGIQNEPYNDHEKCGSMPKKSSKP